MLQEEIKSLSFWRDALAEFLGTFLLVSVQAALPLSWGDAGMGNVVQVNVKHTQKKKEKKKIQR